MTGALNVPAGATGAEVPQAQEIGALADAQLTTHYKRANILGTVSQTAGVPTGAIVQTGSNANGTYVRFADGTQICRHQGISHSTTWGFPIAFSATPQIVGTVVAAAANPRFCYHNGGSSSGVTFYISDLTGPGASGTINAIAIGRWF
jgi:hypothetical protein